MLTQRAVLSRVTGVWKGTYLTLSPDGEVREGFSSRQETRLIGDDWLERIIYYKDPDDPQILDFRATFDDAGDLVFDDELSNGHLISCSEDVLVFLFTWKDQPGVQIVETIKLRLPNVKHRIWQRFEGDQLESVTVIQEQRAEGERPTEWH